MAMKQESGDPTLYEALGVDRDASVDEIRLAWRARTDQAGPGSPEFAGINAAAETLLDPIRRASYDASLPPLVAAKKSTALKPAAKKSTAKKSTAPKPTAKKSTAKKTTAKKSEVIESSKAVVPVLVDQQDSTGQKDSELPLQEKTPLAASSRSSPSGPATSLSSSSPSASSEKKILAAIAAAATAVLVLGVASVVMATGLWQRCGDRCVGEVTDARTAAMAQARQALPVVLSYDYRTMSAVKVNAERFLTDPYRHDYAKAFGLLADAAQGKTSAVAQTKTVVVATVSATAVMAGATDNSVTVLAFVNQSAKQGSAAAKLFQNRIAVTMVKVGNSWLISKLAPR